MAAHRMTLVIHHPVKNQTSTAIGAMTKTPKAKLKYIAPRKYPGSRSNLRSQMEQRSHIFGNPRKMEWRKIPPMRQRGQRCRRMLPSVDGLVAASIGSGFDASR